MGKTRVCGATCHNAKGAKCRCWCGGIFHGTGGQDARERFVEQFGVELVPTTEREFLETTGQPNLFDGNSVGEDWRDTVERARARASTSKPVSQPAAG